MSWTTGSPDDRPHYNDGVPNDSLVDAILQFSAGSDDAKQVTEVKGRWLCDLLAVQSSIVLWLKLYMWKTVRA